MAESLQCDVAVVGVGAMGSATCDALARRGASVVGIERAELGHELGSSGGETRLIRKAYCEHPDYVPLVQRAYGHWSELEERTGVRLLHPTGCLNAGPSDCPLIEGTLLAAREHDLAVEVLEPRTCADAFPQFALPEDFTVLLDTEAGVLLCRKAIEVQVELARRAGAELRFNETVLSWQRSPEGVVLRTDRGEISAGHVVFTAGAWSKELLAGLDLGLRVHRQVFAWLKPNSLETFSVGQFPAWMIETSEHADLGNYYGFPALPGTPGCPLTSVAVKVGHHHPGPVVEPDRAERTISEDDEVHWRPAVERYLPGADGPLVAAKVCFYTTSLDEHFIVDRHPLEENVTLACGFSGHGFKFAPVMGEALADLALEGETSLPIGFLGVDRFLGNPPSSS